jgi:hypothetical protein
MDITVELGHKSAVTAGLGDGPTVKLKVSFGYWDIGGGIGKEK